MHRAPAQRVELGARHLFDPVTQYVRLLLEAVYDLAELVPQIWGWGRRQRTMAVPLRNRWRPRPRWKAPGQAVGGVIDAGGIDPGMYHLTKMGGN